MNSLNLHRLTDRNKIVFEKQLNKENIIACKIATFLVYYNHDIDLANIIAVEAINQYHLVNLSKLINEIIFQIEKFYYDLPYAFGNTLKQLFVEKE